MLHGGLICIAVCLGGWLAGSKPIHISSSILHVHMFVPVTDYTLRKIMSANDQGIFAVTGRAHCQCQVAFYRFSTGFFFCLYPVFRHFFVAFPPFRHISYTPSRLNSPVFMLNQWIIECPNNILTYLLIFRRFMVLVRSWSVMNAATHAVITLN